ncbi:restriction endonuclease subunit S [Altererythrobacter confluentis]|uniref:Restriction endonuclease subunit S n=1 Tax=Allopontixanthobacter confluentis TaxID=1849021 RepID=A0A6L7GM25_9SPHN|nr:restriction endonuclease subunit S [Allopontixanthobacter confluentis]MXP15691.1 restriction endonuclease subunit S [Allopontixanthobacter confluentis]
MLDKASKLSSYRFDKMAAQISHRVMPAETEVGRYVGLEHLDPESLRIRRWGDPSEVESTKLTFEPGDVIFGKRRVYQRKVAVADFHGICSAHAMVLRAKPETVLPDFLPFFMQSDLFMERALSISVGSLSPTINWKALAKEEFLLPPIQVQARLVETLIAAVNAQIELHRSLETLTTMNASLLDARLRGSLLGAANRHERVGPYFEDWPLLPIGKLLTKNQYGLSVEAGSTGQYPMLRMMNMEDGRVVENDLKYIDLSDGEFEKYRLFDGDILFNRTNSFDLVGRTGVYHLGAEHVFASYLVRLQTYREKLDPEYLCAFLNAHIGRRQVMSFATRGVSQTNVNASNLTRILLPLPPISFQRETVEFIRECHAASSRLTQRIKSLGQIISEVTKQGISE